MKHNFYRFSTFSVIAAMGLGLMVAGCSDDGGKTTYYPFSPVNPTPSPTVSPEPSPTPSPEPTVSPSPVAEKATLKVEFNLLEAKTDVPAEISSYNFYLYEGETENTSLLDVAKEADPDTPGQQTVIMEELDPEIDSVVIEYLNAEGKVAGLTEVPVELTAGQETVLDDFECLMASVMYIVGSEDYIAVGGEVSFTGTVIYGEDEEDAVEREIDNEDIEYTAENEQAPNSEAGEAVLEPKEGENGTFAGKANGKAFVKAVYVEGMEAIASVAVTDAEVTGVAIADYMPLVPEADLYMLYAEKALPDSFTERTDGVELPDVQGRISAIRNYRDGDADMPAPPSGYHPSAIVGANSGKVCLVGIMSDDSLIRLTADEWTTEGDFLSCKARGQQAILTVDSAGEGGKLSASYGGKNSEGTGNEAEDEPMTAEANVTALEATARLAIYWNGWNVSSEEETIPLNRQQTIGDWQMIACGLYEFTAPEPEPVPDPRVENYNGDTEMYGLFAPKSNDEVEWLLTSNSEYVTMNSMGLLTVDEQVQVGAEATITYNIEGCDIDMPSTSGNLVN
ncbi:MAG: hypothetical protein K6G50_05970 [bacterium]|nr:hypothetical protein [bacterium]